MKSLSSFLIRKEIVFFSKLGLLDLIHFKIVPLGQFCVDQSEKELFVTTAPNLLKISFSYSTEVFNQQESEYRTH